MTTIYRTCAIVHGQRPLTEHPALPGVPLRAAQLLTPGDVCWIDESGAVYPIEDLSAWRGPYDGYIAAPVQHGDPCTLLTPVTVFRDWVLTLDKR